MLHKKLLFFFWGGGAIEELPSWCFKLLLLSPTIFKFVTLDLCQIFTFI